MIVQDYLRLIAGFFVTLSVALGYYLEQPGFYAFTAFVGLNLVQSSFTKWCPMITILKLLRVPESQSCCGERRSS